MASAEGSVFAVWSACGRVVGQALGADGQPLSGPVDVDGQLHPDANPFVASSGSEYLVLWDHQESSPPRAVQARRYGPPGSPRSLRFQVTANGSSPVAAFDGTNYLLVWQRPLSSRESRRDLFAARMTPTGTVLDADIPIATLPNIPEDAQSVACGGGVCLIAWRHAGIQVRAVRVGPDGTVLDPTPITIPVDGPVATTSTTFDGEAFLVAWREETGAIARRADHPGRPGHRAGGLHDQRARRRRAPTGGDLEWHRSPSRAVRPLRPDAGDRHAPGARAQWSARRSRSPTPACRTRRCRMRRCRTPRCRTPRCQTPVPPTPRRPMPRRLTPRRRPAIPTTSCPRSAIPRPRR